MRSLITILVFILSINASARYRVKTKIENGKVSILSANPILEEKSNALHGKKILRHIPYFIDETQDRGNVIYEEYEISDDLVTSAIRQKMSLYSENANAEFREIVVQGPTENRINLTIVGDGYTAAEKEKFFTDAKRTADGLFVGKTFASYLPLFNVYAVFVPSNESGIGDGSAKDTAFKLYRDPAGSKRAIMPGDESAIDRALQSSPATDYPIIIANDNFYGGLGGRYAISTASERSGLLVLRHELGHNFGEVGEEYDNGMVYRGANSSSSSRVPWTQWIDGQTSVNEAKILSGDYIWQNLIKPYSASFSIPNRFDLLFLNISSVGWDTAKDVSLKLNGNELILDGKFHEDRAFFDIAPTSVKANDKYNLDISQNINDGNNVLGFAIAYAASSNYDFTPNKVGAFSTYNSYGMKSYRPTHNSCIMKNMEFENFCVVDKENMWLKFLARVELIDSVNVNANKVSVTTQKLQDLEIHWYQINTGAEHELTQFVNKLSWDNPGLSGNFRVRIQFSSEEIRKKSDRLSQSKDFKI